jgi:hypothetical protein
LVIYWNYTERHVHQNIKKCTYTKAEGTNRAGGILGKPTVAHPIKKFVSVHNKSLADTYPEPTDIIRVCQSVIYGGQNYT